MKTIDKYLFTAIMTGLAFIGAFPAKAQDGEDEIEQYVERHCGYTRDPAVNGGGDYYEGCAEIIRDERRRLAESDEFYREWQVRHAERMAELDAQVEDMKARGILPQDFQPPRVVLPPRTYTPRPRVYIPRTYVPRTYTPRPRLRSYHPRYYRPSYRYYPRYRRR